MYKPVLATGACFDFRARSRNKNNLKQALFSHRNLARLLTEKADCLSSFLDNIL
jgi:hypothetical protein